METRRQSATRASLNVYANVTGNTGSNSWSGHRTATGIGSLSDIKIGYSNLRSAHPEEVGAGSITMKAAIEYPPGTYTTVRWGGANSKVLAPGDLALSDPINLTIPEDTYFQVHSNVVGAAWSEALIPPRAANNEGVQRGTTTDRTQNPSGMTIANGSVALVPNLIIGRQVTAKRSAIILGDSVSMGILETVPAEYLGFQAIALGNAMGWVQAAQPSIAAYEFGGVPGFTGTDALRMKVMTVGATDCIESLGQNDVADGTPLTLAEIQQGKVYIWYQLQARGIRVWATTITPKSNSSDSFATQANMSPAARQGPGGTRVALNAWIRAGAPLLNGVAVADATSGAIYAGDAGHPVKGWFEIADLVEVNTSGAFTRDTGIWKLSYLATSDGLGTHPNTAGATAMAAGIDVNTILA